MAFLDRGMRRDPFRDPLVPEVVHVSRLYASFLWFLQCVFSFIRGAIWKHVSPQIEGGEPCSVMRLKQALPLDIQSWKMRDVELSYKEFTATEPFQNMVVRMDRMSRGDLFDLWGSTSCLKLIPPTLAEDW